MPRLLPGALTVALLVLVAACGGGGSNTSPSGATPSTSTAAPAATEAATATVAVPNAAPATEIDVPDGYTAYKVAGDFNRATSIAVSTDGTIYVSERHGTIFRLADNDGDGVFEDLVSWANASAEAITGLLAAPDGDGLYVSVTGKLDLYQDTDGDGIGDTSRGIIGELPSWRHQNNGAAFGPDGKLYLTNGSTCDDCDEADERSATILRANGDGSGMRVYATGLRNPYDLVFDDEGRLWATDNGSDAPCETPDELNLIVEGGDYGWPYGAEGCDAFADGTAPVADLGLHTASTGIEFYDGTQFPQEAQGSLFLTLWGGLVASPTLKPSLQRVTIDDASEPPQATVETFATGFRHPIDVLADRDGTLLVLDYGDESDPTGALYRIVYTGG